MSKLQVTRMKNPTPQHIALGSALIISVLVVLLFLVFKEVFGIRFNWSFFLLFAGSTFCFSYIILINALEIFIYRKIKLIYKIISKEKQTKQRTSSNLNMNKDLISDIEHEVKKSIRSDNEEIRQLKLLEEYRRQFLGNVSHELRTPIFLIQGYLETLLDGGLSDSNINLKYLQKASQNVDRINSIIADLEMISMIENGQLALEKEDFNLWELVEDVFESLSFLASANQIEMKFKKGFLSPCLVSCDKEHIRQVFVILLTNGIKYNHKGGEVTVGAYDMDKKILIEVSDDGIGIEEIYFPRIFERFFRVSKSRSREKGGTGLGLAIVKHILEAHGESIHVRSTLGEGSTFGFTLEKYATTQPTQNL